MADFLCQSKGQNFRALSCWSEGLLQACKATLGSDRGDRGCPSADLSRWLNASSALDGRQRALSGVLGEAQEETEGCSETADAFPISLGCWALGWWLVPFIWPWEIP